MQNMFGENTLLTDEHRIQIEIDFYVENIEIVNRLIDMCLDGINESHFPEITNVYKAQLADFSMKKDRMVKELDLKRSILEFLRG